MSEHPYPPEPWNLRGRGDITVRRVAVDRLPALPVGVRPVTVRSRALVATVWVDYSAAGLLPYHELLAAVVVLHGRRLALTITDIWVDSPISRAGGRELWGIPKERADFTPGGASGWSARLDGLPIAEASFTPGRLPAVPLPVSLPSRVIQTLAGATVASRISARGRVRPARSTWTLAGDGPLGWLEGSSPLLSISAEDFRMTFGPRLG